ncbi:MAG: hypothetical protein HRU36_00740 [Rickettsiales bacterium]|nr:hypothetical protein [Rickettsiales bacterium]
MLSIESINNNIIQSINNNIVLPTKNYVTEHPYISVGTATLINTAIFGPTIASAIGLALIKPHLKPYIESYLDKYPYVSQTIGIASIGVGIYFGGTNILNNIQNIFTSKLGLGLVGITTASFGIGTHYLGIKKTSKMYEECLDQTISIEISIDYFSMPDPNSIYAPAFGYFSSCVIRKISRDIYLDETSSHSKLATVSFISGAIGGSLKYGAKAIVLENEVLKYTLVGIFNHAGYVSITACVKREILPLKVDELSPFIVEPIDVITGALVNLNNIDYSNFKASFEAASVMYLFSELFLPIIEDSAPKISNVFLNYTDSGEIDLAGNNADIEPHDEL